MTTKPIRSFTDLVGVLSRGRFSEKCNDHLTHALETLEALPDAQGKATLTVTLNIAFQEGRVEVTPSVKSKLPEEKGFAGTPFWSMDGGFSVQHPSQSDMFAGPRASSDAPRSRDSA
ncbi:hypothetical protein [Methylobacterium sp. Leaf100]|uniref:hypothetical protein n=1 Tax=Methylobacterium sp. Leaf100 TaxID=1736252 RepID=UPI0006F9DEC9|nr:hypothetical protein [Methylobacterium sp. Leaf100]KQP36677.1 hypothetical protein ASF25_01600 [Methylobacterium sp. Leaf100]